MKTFLLTTLTATILATAAIAQSLSGTYLANGRNADGSAYAGTVAVTQNGQQVGITWTVGNGSYAGVGLLEGRVLTVNWGAATPVIYVLMPDGTWENGRALEKLTPQ